MTLGHTSREFAAELQELRERLLLMAARVEAGTYPNQAVTNANARAERAFALAAKRGDELPTPPDAGKRVPHGERKTTKNPATPRSEAGTTKKKKASKKADS